MRWFVVSLFVPGGLLPGPGHDLILASPRSGDAAIELEILDAHGSPAAEGLPSDGVHAWAALDLGSAEDAPAAFGQWLAASEPLDLLVVVAGPDEDMGLEVTVYQAAP
jgi:NAD(P)-dependent dehydrogenase (short-subunit alcohol dehydrogenase family)